MKEHHVFSSDLGHGAEVVGHVPVLGGDLDPLADGDHHHQDAALLDAAAAPRHHDAGHQDAAGGHRHHGDALHHQDAGHVGVHLLGDAVLHPNAGAAAPHLVGLKGDWLMRL